jgi:prolipoprotein diacylglyceryltransferase
VGLLGARIGFILFQFSQFGFQPLHWLNINTYPGFNLITGILAAGIYIYHYANKHKWDVFEIVDFWVLGLSFALAMVWIGLFLDGTSFGNSTSLPIGVVFPGVFEPHHPIQLYFAAVYFLLFWYLSWADFHYRTFNWYRAGKNTAQTGYMTSIFIMVTGLFSLAMSFLRPPQLVVMGVGIDIPVYLLTAIVGAGLLWHRSGRSFALALPKRARS